MHYALCIMHYACRGVLTISVCWSWSWVFSISMDVDANMQMPRVRIEDHASDARLMIAVLLGDAD